MRDHFAVGTSSGLTVDNGGRMMAAGDVCFDTRFAFVVDSRDSSFVNAVCIQVVLCRHIQEIII